jgi:2-(1,2-epoxy-1,2-dihydrophenyl)acetyl-CoA isomerase
MDLGTVKVDITDGVARLLLHRPDTANAIDSTLARDLFAAARHLRGRDDVRAVLLSGTGPVFCGGGDVPAFAREADLPARIREMTHDLHGAISILVNLDAPVLAAVQGAAAGAGLGLVGMADLVIAAESARFVMAYTRVGLTPDGSTSWFLPRLVGSRRSLELALLNRALTAAEALEWGLVNRVVDDSSLTAEADAMAAMLAAGPTEAFGATKRLLRDGWNETLETHMAREAEQIALAAARAEGKEGVAAFVEKRSPSFHRD